MLKVNNEAKISALIDKLPSFYRDYLYDTKFIQVLFDTYNDIMSYLSTYVTNIKNNTTINTAELYRDLGIHTLTLVNSLYDVTDIARKFETATGLNWFSEDTSIKDKITFLDSEGRFEYLSLYRDWDTEISPIVFTDIAKQFSSNTLNYDVFTDFILTDNKLYVFNDLAKIPSIGSVKPVLLNNVMVDYHKIENRWGSFFPFVSSEFFTRYEYRNFISAALKFKPTIADIKEVMSGLSVSSNSYFRDSYSRKNLPVELLGKEENLLPFQFVYKLPDTMMYLLYPPLPEDAEEELIAYFTYIQGKSRSISNFLKVIKPSYTDLIIEGSMVLAENTNALLNETVTLKASYGLEIIESVPVSEYLFVRPPAGQYSEDYFPGNTETFVCYDDGVYSDNFYFEESSLVEDVNIKLILYPEAGHVFLGRNMIISLT